MAQLAVSERQTMTARVVAIEPDPLNAAALAALCAGHPQLSIDVVATIWEAVQAIERGAPDLIMTPPLLHPADEADLIARLKQMPHARHVPVVHIPAGVTEAVAAQREESSPRFSVFRRRGPARRGCDISELQAQMLSYVHDARATQPAAHLPLPRPASLVVIPETSALVPAPGVALEPTQALRSGRERRRARRRRREEMPWLWTVKLPWGSDVRVVDMSSTGMLIETPTQLDAGGTVELKMIGEQENVVVPARTMRSEAAWAESGVLYRVGLEFAQELDSFGRYPLSVTAALRPRTLTDLLARVMTDVERGTDPAKVRKRFTRELMDLVPARRIRFQHTSTPGNGDDLVHFSVPNTADPGIVLEVAFERGHAPSVLEFRFLKAAAAAAGIVAAFSPALEQGPASQALQGIKR